MNLETFEARCEELGRDRLHVVTLEHADKSRTYIFYDEDAEYANPRSDDWNVTTLVQESQNYDSIDEPDSDLADARERFSEYDYSETRWLREYGSDHGSWWYRTSLRRARSRHDREDMVRRYLAIYRPDILHYEDHDSWGSAYGWGYITREAWNAAMGTDYPGPVTLAKAYEAESKLYRQWAEGEVYGAVHIRPGGPIVLVDVGQDPEELGHVIAHEDASWGFLGYSGPEEIAANFTDSPVVK